jgi:aminotransferase in exopolysaccharide biosynthesis
MFDDFIAFVQEIYNTTEFIPLHSPQFIGNEKKYVSETIDSTFVSSVGGFVEDFELKVAEFTGLSHAVAVMNGTSALHLCLLTLGVKHDTEVITQSLTFVATCNAIKYCGANPIFIDVDKDTLGLSPISLLEFLQEFCEIREDGFCWNKLSNKRVSACLPMHTFGFPVKLNEIKKICDRYNIEIVEDIAESFGSFYNGNHTGSLGKLSAVSFNGNKILTSGGGGMILTNNELFAKKIKHLSTTAKVKHDWLYEHDEIGFNYRLPNLNAALGLAQLETLPERIKNKRNLANIYQKWGEQNDIHFVCEPVNTKSNYWLNTVITSDKNQRDTMLKVTNSNKVMTRPAWKPMHQLEMNSCYYSDSMANTNWLYDRVVNVPSTPINN